MGYAQAFRFGLSVFALQATLACSDRKEDPERAARSQQTLAVQVSAELDVERYPDLRSYQPVDNPVRVCGSVRCAVFYKIGDYVHARRIDQSGQVLDQPPIVIGRGDAPRAAAANNDDFVVIWGKQGDYRATRLRGTSGEISDLTSNLPGRTTSGGYYLVSNGNTWLLTEIGTPQRFYVKAKDTFATVAGPSSLDISLPSTNLFAGQGQYLLSYYKWAFRISEATGAVLDLPSGIEFVKYGDLPEYDAQAAYKDGTWVLTWSRDGKVYLSRIRASDGARLDPDDDFNQVSGVKTIVSGPNDAYASRVYPWTGSALVTWYTSNGTSGDFHASRVDVATGTRADGSTTTGEANLPALDVDPYLQGSWGMGFHVNTVRPLQIQQVPPQLTLGAHSQNIIVVSEERTYPSVAWNGSGFFVAWIRNDVGAGGFQKVVGSRVSASGQYLDDPPLVLGEGYRAVVTARGGDYLVAWSPDISATTAKTIQRRFVTAGGQLGPLLPAIAMGNASDELQLTYNGKYFLLTWSEYPSSVKAIRLRSDGTAVEATPLTLTANFGINANSRLSTLADTTPAENMRSFVVAYGGPGTQARLIRSESGVLIDPPSNLSAELFRGGASDQSRMFMVLNGAPTSSGAFLDPVTGSFQAPGLRSLGGTSTNAVSNVWYDGKSFLVALRASTGVDTTFAVRRYSATALSELDGTIPNLGTTITSTVNVPYPYASIASDSGGRSLFAYVVHDPTRLGSAIKMRLLTNDGLTSGAGGTGGTGGASGSGGTAGTAGSSGSAGTTGSGGTAGSGGAVGADSGTQGSGGTQDSGGVSPDSSATGGTGGSAGAGASGGSAGSAGTGVTGGTAGSAGDDAGAETGGPAGSSGTAGAGSGGEPGSGGTNGAVGSAGASSSSGGSSAAGPADSGRDSAAAGASNPAPSDDGGCGCRQTARNELGSAGIFCAGLALALIRRRRRCNENDHGRARSIR